MLVKNGSLAHSLKFYSGKKVFITGHTGFKGAWLTLLMQQAGAEIMGYSLEPENPSLYKAISDQLQLNSVIADIRDFKKLDKEVQQFEPDFIFHLAAQPLVRYSYQQPLETFEVNVMGTANLLETARKLTKPCSAVIVTTDKVYENNETGLPFKETDPLGGHDPYSSSKACAELVCQSYMRSFSDNNYLGIATARAGNVIGGGDYATDRIIPDLVKAFINNQTLQIRNPQSVRPWQHVLDPLAGYIKLGLLLNTDPHKYTGSYNFGPMEKDHCTVKEIVEMAIKQWGSGYYEIPEQINQPHEAVNLKLDITKSINKLDWKPVWNSKVAVEKTINWYKDLHSEQDKSIEFCLRDLGEFYLTT